MTAFTTLVDQDRNLRFDYPADWSVTVEQSNEYMPDFITVWSPSAPDGSAGVLVGVALEWHEEPDLQAFVNRRLEWDQQRASGLTLRGRSNGRHPTSGLLAVTVSCDMQLNGTFQRKEMIFLEVSPGVVLYASALCPAATRHLWRVACKMIFGTLNVIDPLRPPAASSGALIGVGLPSGCSDQIKRMWMLLDVTAKGMITATNQIFEDEQVGITLGAAADFETRVYLLHELTLTMLGFAYQAEAFQKIRSAFIRAITGRRWVDPPPPQGPLARLHERQALYLLADNRQHKSISKERILLYAELVTTSGAKDAPATIDPALTYTRRSIHAPAKAHVVDIHLPLTRTYRLSLCNLFRETPDIEALPIQEMDRRFNAAINEVSEPRR